MVDDVKYKVAVTPDVSPSGEVVELPEDVLYKRIREAGWTDDPGQGKAVLTPLGSEILCPIPVSPPIGYIKEESAMERLERMLQQRLAQLLADDVLDESEEEANDFDVPDPEDFEPRSMYEIQMVPEAPALPREPQPPSDTLDKAPSGEVDVAERSVGTNSP